MSGPCAFPECGEPEDRNRHRNAGCVHPPVLLCHQFVPPKERQFWASPKGTKFVRQTFYKPKEVRP